MLRIVVLMWLLAVEGSAAALPNNGKTLTAFLHWTNTGYWTLLTYSSLLSRAKYTHTSLKLTRYFLFEPFVFKARLFGLKLKSLW